jgi:hypothetical protein
MHEDSGDDYYDEEKEPTCGVFQPKTSSLTRIIGGHPSKKGHWPWQVAILNKHRASNIILIQKSD